MRIKFFDNEAALLITGDILMAAGGVILGLLIELSSIRYFLMPVCILFFGLGGYFDYRSIRTFSAKLIQLKDEIKKSQEQLESTISHSKEIEKKLTDTQKAISESEERIKTAEEKVFGISGTIFASSSWSHPIDKTVSELESKVKELERTIKDLQQQINRMNRGF